MDAVTAGSGFMGMLQPLQLPEKPGVTPRFSDLFAARTLESASPADVGPDDLMGVLPGSPFGAVVHDLSAPGGFMPLALPTSDAVREAPVATDALDMPTVVDAGTPGLSPRHVALTVEPPTAPASAPRTELPGEWVSTPAETGAAANADAVEMVPSADLRKLTNAQPGLDAPVRPLPTPVPGPAATAAESVDVKTAPDANAPVSLAETLAEDGERQAATPRVVSGVEVATLATLSPRAPGMPGPDQRATAQRANPLAAVATSGVAAVEVTDAAVEAPTAFDPSAGFDDVPTPTGLAAAVTTRAQPTTAVSAGSPDMPVNVTTAFDPAPRNTATVEDVNALDQLDAPSEMAELSIDTPVDDPNWSEALNYRLQWLAQKGGAQSARIQLNPVELGPMEVHVEVVEDVATVQIRADHGLTREALEQAAPRLRELLLGAGIEHADLEVSGGDAEDGRRAGANLSDNPSDRRDDAQNAGVNTTGPAAGSTEADRAPGNSPTAGIDLNGGGELNLYV